MKKSKGKKLKALPRVQRVMPKPVVRYVFNGTTYKTEKAANKAERLYTLTKMGVDFKRIPKSIITAIDGLCEHAMTWGWQQDQGTGPSVNRSEKNYLTSYAELLKEINKWTRSSKAQRKLKAARLERHHGPS